MATHKLTNYIRMYRKHSGLTQKEIAYLLGWKSSAGVCRCESFKREQSLETALAYEAIFRVPVSELFAGVFEKVEKKVKRRAELLARRLINGEQNKFTNHKLDSLAIPYRGTRERLRPNA